MASLLAVGYSPEVIRDKGTLAATRIRALMEWTRIPAYIAGTVDQELLLRNEYLSAENPILRAQLKRRLALSDAERAKLADIGFSVGSQGPGRGGDRRPTGHHPDVVPTARRSQIQRIAGTTSAGPTTENRPWGDDRMVGALGNLRSEVSYHSTRESPRRHRRHHDPSEPTMGCSRSLAM